MLDLNQIPALDENELEQLGVLLEQEAEQNDGFDFFAAHGLITALCAGPCPFELADVWALAFDDKPSFDSAQRQTLDTLFQKLANEIQAWLDSGQDFPVPCDLTLVEDEDDEPLALESWAMGYMTAVLAQEERWYQSSEQASEEAEAAEAKVAEGLFPIMYASGLFMDHEDMTQIDDDIALSNQMCENIPAAVIELYLYFHSR